MRAIVKGEDQQMKPPPAEKPGAGRKAAFTAADFEYLEQRMKLLTEELKRKVCLSQDFRFLTKKERDASLEWHIDQFLKEH